MNYRQLILLKSKKNTAFLLLIVSVLNFIGLNGCKQYTNVEGVSYENPDNWISRPRPEKAVDVFYVYPTVSSDSSGSMDITNEKDRALAVGIFKAQGSVFDSCANVFAPYYRQMSTNVNVTGDSLATDTDQFKQGAKDVQSAFDYFIKSLNNNRPFILAGHSQGTMALIELIKSRFANNDSLRNRLVAAYLIGYTVTEKDLLKSGLKAAKDSIDVGVVISYNTQSRTSQGGPMLMEGAHCINPLSWSTDTRYVDSTFNIEAVFFNDTTGEVIRKVKNYCGAKIDTCKQAFALKVQLPASEDLEIGPYSEGVYHRYDYAFWYKNLEKNVVDRIHAFQANSE